MYILFLISTRATFVSITVFLSILFVTYLIDNHKKFFYKDEDGVITNPEMFRRMSIAQNVLLSIAIVVTFVGCYNYYSLKRVEYAKEWDWSKFVWGVQKCKQLK